MKKNNNIITLKAELPAYGAFSICRVEGKVAMIKGAIPGETVRVKIDEEKKDYYRASTIEVLDPSPDRETPACKFFGLCGGCNLQYITHQRQILIKDDVLRDCLKRLAKIEMPLESRLSGDNPWNYRYRGQFKISRGKTGFYREKTREVIDIDACPLMSGPINMALPGIKPLLSDLDSGEVHISCGDGVIALLKIPEHSGDSGKLAARFLDEGFSGISVIAGDRPPLFFGKPHITLDLCKLHYTVSSMSFFQSHWLLNQRVVALVKETLQPLKGKRVLDLYSGAGNFALPIAVDAEEVIAIEESHHAIEDGKRNLKTNNIKNCRFIHSAVEGLSAADYCDILIADPPRLGLTSSVVNSVLTMKPERIVYISCNPTTLARDLKKLSASYDVESVRMIDFFPQTYHIESLTFLKLR